MYYNFGRVHQTLRVTPAMEAWIVSRKDVSMTTIAMKPRVTSFAPQFLVDDLERSIAYYRKLGFTFGEPWDGFYAIGELDGLELHLKEAPKNQAERRWRRDNEHLDASAGVDGIEAFYEQCVANGVTIIKPLAATAWGTKDFYLEDPDGYIICFGGRPAEGLLEVRQDSN
jgi:catechol 2,3-dioxygenase-like lactoylglutathione lyase family enzyme